MVRKREREDPLWFAIFLIWHLIFLTQVTKQRRAVLCFLPRNSILVEQRFCNKKWVYKEIQKTGNQTSGNQPCPPLAPANLNLLTNSNLVSQEDLKNQVPSDFVKRVAVSNHLGSGGSCSTGTVLVSHQKVHAVVYFHDAQYIGFPCTSQNSYLLLCLFHILWFLMKHINDGPISCLFLNLHHYLDLNIKLY